MWALVMASAVLLRAAVALAGRFPALAGVDLVVAPGEVVVLEGPNGAGKTSLLRACAGLLPITAGDAEVLGFDLRRDRVGVRREVGFLGHDAALYDDLTVVENVRFAVRAGAAGGRRARAASVEAGVDAALERLGLIGRLRRTPAGRLSAGQRRRVALAVVVARRPALWLLDEPHAAFDAGARAVLDDVVREAAAAGAAVILASHEPHASSPLADRIVSMVGGRVSADHPAARSDGGASDALGNDTLEIGASGGDEVSVLSPTAAPTMVAPTLGSGGLHVA
jgi:heme ABC exporter ATP-binding subunit CcmA